MTELIDNKLKKYFKEKFISKDGAEWYCVLDGNKPIGEVQITYFSNSGNKWTIKGRWVGTVDNGYIEGYGILENHYSEFKIEGFFIKGQFCEGRYIKNKNNKHNTRWIKLYCEIDESKCIRYPNGIIKNKIIKGKIEFDDGISRRESCDRYSCRWITKFVSQFYSPQPIKDTLSNTSLFLLTPQRNIGTFRFILYKWGHANDCGNYCNVLNQP